jgi:hypothetical protein
MICAKAVQKQSRNHNCMKIIVTRSKVMLKGGPKKHLPQAGVNTKWERKKLNLKARIFFFKFYKHMRNNTESVAGDNHNGYAYLTVSHFK